jgi:predicted TIM-barrel fold metal-dependent hydrolase
MSYAGGRLIHDADSHIMELPDCLDPYLDATMRGRLHNAPGYRRQTASQSEAADLRDRHSQPEFRRRAGDELMVRKNHDALGSFIREDRPSALDHLGFASQLVFTTFCLGNFDLDHEDDLELAYAAADGHNRMITDFCSVDRRLLPVGYVPLEDFERTRSCAERAVRLGAKGIMIPSKCPRRHSPSHVGFDALWAIAAEAGVPIIFHVGGEDRMNPVYKINGRPPVRDFHGGDSNFTSVSYMSIPHAAMQTLSTLVFDGVFDRFPTLKFAAIELGASWVPGWMRSLDSAAHAFRKNEERLQNLSAKPSEILRRQFRAAPYPHEDAGWIIGEAGAEIPMFSSDFPHVEGGRHPIKRFDEWLSDCSLADRDRFYAGNFEDLMGRSLEPLRRPAPRCEAD